MKFDVLVENLLKESYSEMEYIQALHDNDIKKALKICEMAARSQRGYPEAEMLRTNSDLRKYAGIHGFLITLLEHIGDLSHRAQTTGSIGEPAHQLLEVSNKIKLVEKTLCKNCRSLKQQLQDDFTSIAERYIIDNNIELKKINDSGGIPNTSRSMFEFYEFVRNKYATQIEKKINELNEYTKQRLKKYAEIHEKYNKPVTYIGQLCKEASVSLGLMDFDKLIRIIKIIREWYTRYENSNEQQQLKMFLQPKLDEI